MHHLVLDIDKLVFTLFVLNLIVFVGSIGEPCGDDVHSSCGDIYDLNIEPS